MKGNLLLFCVVILFSCSKKMVVMNKQAIEIEWLVGVWKNKDKEMYEKWIKVSESEYRGVGYDMTAGYATITESIKLYKEGKDWYYEAKVAANNNVPVKFTLVPDPVYTLKFINEKHDFPQMISYKKDAFDVMSACISDMANTKVECSENTRFVNK
jgi:hypothetical protein